MSVDIGHSHRIAQFGKLSCNRDSDARAAGRPRRAPHCDDCARAPWRNRTRLGGQPCRCSVTRDSRGSRHAPVAVACAAGALARARAGAIPRRLLLLWPWPWLHPLVRIQPVCTKFCRPNHRRSLKPPGAGQPTFNLSPRCRYSDSLMNAQLFGVTAVSVRSDNGEQSHAPRIAVSEQLSGQGTG